MNTPITDALADKWAGDPDARGYREELEEVAPRLELDRAALMEALEKILGVTGATTDGLTMMANLDGRIAFYNRLKPIREEAKTALATARANFP